MGAGKPGDNTSPRPHTITAGTRYLVDTPPPWDGSRKGAFGRPIFIHSAGAGGNCTRPMRLPDPSPALDKNRAPMGPEILSSAGAGVWRKAPMAFPNSSSVLDKFQSASFRNS